MGGGVAADLIVHVGADIADATQGLSSVGKSVDSAGKGFQKAGLLMGGASLAIVGGLGLAVGSAMSFEQSIADVTSLGGEYAASQEKISALAMEIGAKTKFSATEGAAAIGELAKAGIPVEDILNGAAMAASNLAAAGGQSIPEAATSMATAMNLFGISGKDAASVADVFAAAANSSASDVATLSQALAQGGPAAAAMGMSLEDTTAALALFSNYGIQGSDAGTSMKTMLQSLANPSQEAADKMAELGIHAFDATGKFVGMEGLAGQLKSQLSGLTDEQRNAALAIMFGSDASRVANVLYQEGAEGVAKMNKEVRKKGAADEMAAAKMNTLQGAIEQFRGSLETAMIIIGTGFIPILRKGADFLTKIMNAFVGLSPKVQKLAGVVAAGTAGFLALAAGLSMVIGFFGPVMAGIGALALPILLVVGVLAALWLAWQTNFLGIQDLVTNVAGQVGDALHILSGFLEHVANGAGITAGSLSYLPEPLHNLAKVLGLAVRGFMSFWNNLQAGRGVLESFSKAWDIFGSDKMVNALKNLGGQLLGAITGLPWGSIGSALLNGLIAAAGMVGDAAGWLLGQLGDLAATLGGWLWDQASSVDWKGLLSAAAGAAGDITGAIVDKLGDLTASIGSWLSRMASMVNWSGILRSAASAAGDVSGAILNGLGDLTASIVSWLTDKATAVPWGAILSTAAGAAGDITGVIVSKLGDLALALGIWIGSAAIGLPWGSIVSGVSDVVGTIVSKLGDLAMGLKTWYDNAIANVQWNTLGERAGQAVGDVSRALAPKAWEMITGLGTAIGENWQTIGKILLGFFLGLPAIIGYIGFTMAPKALELITGFITGLGINWPLIGNWFASLPGKLLAATPAMASTLLTAGQQLIQGLTNGAQAVWPTLSGWLARMPGLILNLYVGYLKLLYAVGSGIIHGLMDGAVAVWPTLSSWMAKIPGLILNLYVGYLKLLYAVGRGIIQGLLDGAQALWPSVSTWLGKRGPEAVTAVGNLAKTLLSRGTELIGGLADALGPAWSSLVEPQLAGIADGAASAVGDLSGSLVDAGWNVMRGFLSGLQGGWNEVTGWLSGLNPADWKGPPERDRKMLIENGLLTMAGYREGLGIGWKAATRQMHDMKPEIPQPDWTVPASQDQLRMFAPDATGNPEAGAARSRNFQALSNRNSPQTINQYNTIEVKLDELEDMVEAGRFVRQLNPTRQMYITE